jgi:hypothetical protein
MSSLFIFLFGLISEQIAAMRFESSQRPVARIYDVHAVELEPIEGDADGVLSSDRAEAPTD